MRANVDRRKVLLILDWCIMKFGLSKFQDDYPQLRVYKSKGKSYYENKKLGLRGTYLDGTITIYLGTITSVKELCETVIHEYMHYLMNDVEYDKLERKLMKAGRNKEYVYDNHPHEKRALRMEEKWGEICFNELRNRLYKH